MSADNSFDFDDSDQEDDQQKTLGLSQSIKPGLHSSVRPEFGQDLWEIPGMAKAIVDTRPNTGPGKTINLGQSNPPKVEDRQIQTAKAPIKLGVNDGPRSTLNKPIGLQLRTKPSLGRLKANPTVAKSDDSDSDKDDGFDPTEKKKVLGGPGSKLGKITLKKEEVVVKKAESSSESGSEEGDDTAGVIVQSEIQNLDKDGNVKPPATKPDAPKKKIESLSQSGSDSSFEEAMPALKAKPVVAQKPKKEKTPSVSESGSESDSEEAPPVRAPRKTIPNLHVTKPQTPGPSESGSYSEDESEDEKQKELEIIKQKQAEVDAKNKLEKQKKAKAKAKALAEADAQRLAEEAQAEAELEAKRLADEEESQEESQEESESQEEEEENMPMPVHKAVKDLIHEEQEPEEDMEMEENDGNDNKQQNRGTPNQNYQLDDDEEQQENEDRDPNGVEYACVNVARLEDLDLSDPVRFCTSFPPPGQMVQCTITRDKSSIGKKFLPVYHVTLSKEGTYLLTAKKRGFNKTSNYVLAAKPNELQKNSPFCIGKVRSNFLGTEFNAYSSGKNPSKSKKVDLWRYHYACVKYEKNIFGMKGPRKMQCYVPGVTDDGELVRIRPKAKKDAIYPRWKKGDRTGLMKLINKPPKWSEEYQAFVLNFYGRVRLASVKNFQIVDEDRPDFIFLQFGKVNEHSFTMDFQWPFTPVQAMMICLSSFDFKWACE